MWAAFAVAPWCSVDEPIVAGGVGEVGKSDGNRHRVIARAVAGITRRRFGDKNQTSAQQRENAWTEKPGMRYS